MQTTTLPIAAIIARPGRQRQQFTQLSLHELAESIRARGLLHALLIDSEGYLVAGERRLRAIREHILPLGGTFTYAGHPVPPGEVPVLTVASTDPLELEEVELAENLAREDLTWQEKAEAHARLHRLRLAQLDVINRVANQHGEDPVQHTPADTAREVHGTALNAFRQDEVRQEILIAPHLSKPEVAKAVSLKDAYKILKRIEDAERNRALAAIMGTSLEGEHTLLHGDCLELMTGWKERFDVILTDPPYGMGAHEFGDGAGRLLGIDHQYDDSHEAWSVLMNQWCSLAYQAARPEAHAYIFCDLDRFHELKGHMQLAGWYVFRTPFIYFKDDASGRVPLPDKGPRRQYEILLFAIKGGKTVNYIGSDVIRSIPDEGTFGHGAKKSVNFLTELLRRSVRPGDRVLDSFAGTGSIIPAGHSQKCRVTAIEKEAGYYGLCLRRVEALPKQGEMAL